jgi:hypothetical protein
MSGIAGGRPSVRRSENDLQWLRKNPLARGKPAGSNRTLRIELIGVEPHKGTLDNTLYDPNGYVAPTLEAFTLYGVRS